MTELNDFEPAPPNNIEAEQALLGALMLNNNHFDFVSDFLLPEHFFDALHGRIYEAIGEKIKSGRKATPITLKEHFERDETMTQIGGPVYLARLVGAAATIVHVEAYARTIQDLHVRRGLMTIAAELRATAADAPIDLTPGQMGEDASSAITELVTRGMASDEMRSIGDAVSTAVDQGAEAYEKGVPVGISTGLPSCDAIVGPMTPGMVIVLGGATSMGKTALAEEIGDYNAEQGEVVAFFSLEMMAEDLALRSVAKLCRVPAWRIETGKFTEKEWDSIWEAKNHFASIPMFIDDKRGLKVSQIRTRALRLKRKKGKLGLLIIDHMQFIQPNNEKAQQSTQFEQITRDVKAMAGDLRCPVILLSHVSRETQKRDDRRPKLSDLHGSSGIEKDADVVLFVHRPEYYLERDVPEENSPDWLKWSEQMAKWKGRAELILAKRRKGKGAGSRQVNFTGDFTEFTEIEAAPPLTQQEIEAQEAFAL